MSKLPIILLLLLSLSLSAQNTFFKRIRLSDKAQGGLNILKIEDTIFLNCYNLNQYSSFGTYLMKVDVKGNNSTSNFIEDLKPFDRSILEDNSDIMLSGNDIFSFNKQKLYRISKDLDILHETILFDSINDYESTFQLGLNKYEGRFHISTSSLDNNKTNLFDYVVNPLGKMDTILQLPISDAKTFREMFVNKRGEMTYFYNRAFSQLEDENGILTYKNGVFTNLWKTGGYQRLRRVVPRGLQLKDGGYVLANINKDFSPIPSILKLSEDGDEIWTYEWFVKGSRGREIRKIIECSNGDIIGVGVLTEYDYTPKAELCAMVFRLDKDGKLLWEKAYYELEDGEATRGVISDIVELDDGSFMATGEIRSKETFVDILLMRIDADGCIDNFSCGKTVLVTDVKDLSQNKEQLRISPNPFSNQLNITSHFDKPLFGSILNLNGRVIHQFEINSGTTNTSIDLEQLSAGFNLLILKDKHGTVLHKEKVIKI